MNTKLKQKRELAGLSQSELANLAGVNLRMVQYYEQGVKDINKAAVGSIKKIAVALQCKIEDLID